MLSLFQREDWTVEEKRHERLADAVNAALRPTDGYFVHFQINRAQREPSPTRFVKFVRDALARLPPHEILLESLPALRPRQHLPSAIYEETDVLIEVEFVPMAPNAPSKSDPDARIVGTGAITGGMVNSAERLKKKVAAKAGGRYKIEQVPFLVLAGLHDMFCSEDQVLAGLYGGDRYSLSSGELGRRNDGLFGPDLQRDKGRHKRLSAVGIISGLRWKPESNELSIMHNPYASRPWPDYIIPNARNFGVIQSTGELMRLDWR